jgi:hypothetical protein
MAMLLWTLFILSILTIILSVTLLAALSTDPVEDPDRVLTLPGLPRCFSRLKRYLPSRGTNELLNRNVGWTEMALPTSLQPMADQLSLNLK